MCRRLSVKGLPVDLGGLQTNRLTHLAYGACTIPERKQLVSRDIAIISNMTSLKSLELCEWQHWDDLTPLGLLCLEKLRCVSFCMLLDLGPLDSLGYMQMLRKVTIELSATKHWAEWLGRKNLLKETALAMVAETLHELPKLLILEDGIGVDDVSMGEGVVNDVVVMHTNCGYEGLLKGIVKAIVATHPTYWRWEGSTEQERYIRVRG